MNGEIKERFIGTITESVQYKYKQVFDRYYGKYRQGLCNLCQSFVQIVQRKNTKIGTYFL